MIRDVSVVLGADAGPVMAKIQCCRTHDDLFAFMMGIKKVISIYADRAKADQFASRYEALSRSAFTPVRQNNRHATHKQDATCNLI